MRTVVAVIVGVLVGAAVVFGVETLGNLLFPLPEGIDGSDPDRFAEFLNAGPSPALISVLVAWALGALVGGAVAGKIARYQWQVASVTVGALLLVAGGATMLQVPHPLWMWIAGVVLPLPLAWFGAHLTHNLAPLDGAAPARRGRRLR